jgi:hypothetical protein
VGSVVLSVDAELGWGLQHLEEPPVARVEASREAWRTLLSLLDDTDVPATWAVVGHLMLAECDGVHADHPAPPGWFDQERESWRDRPDLRYGTDLVEAVLAGDPDHELACHSFSHVLFEDPRVTREVVHAELAAAIDVARRWDIQYESFVFPKNQIRHRDLLAEYGFTCYRSRAPTADSRLLQSMGKLLDAAVPGRVGLGQPRVDEHGLVDVPPSMFLFGFEGLARTAVATLGRDPIVRQAKWGIDRACEEEGVFHIWLHPNNMHTPRDVERVRAVLEYVAERRAETDLRVETMADVARRTLQTVTA